MKKFVRRLEGQVNRARVSPLTSHHNPINTVAFPQTESVILLGFRYLQLLDAIKITPHPANHLTTLLEDFEDILGRFWFRDFLH